MKKETPAVIPEKIHVLGVRILESHFETTEEYLSKPEPPAKTNVQIGHGPGLDMAQHLYFVKLDLILTGLNAEDNPLGLSARYTIHFAYRVDNLEELVIINKDNTLIDNNLAATIIGMSYSTARGIVLERTQGTFFNGAILPVIDVFDFLKNSVSENQLPQLSCGKKRKSKESTQPNKD